MSDLYKKIKFSDTPIKTADDKKNANNYATKECGNCVLKNTVCIHAEEA